MKNARTDRKRWSVSVCWTQLKIANLSEHPEYTIRTADQALYDAGIDEGDRVWFDPESGQIEKAAESH